MLVMAATRTTRSLSAAEQLEASKKLYVKTESLRATKQPPPGGPPSPPRPPPVPPRPINRSTSIKFSPGTPPVGPPPPLPPRRKSTSTDDRDSSGLSIDKQHQALPPVPPPRPSRGDKPLVDPLARKSSTPTPQLPPVPQRSRLASTPLWARQSSPNLLKLAFDHPSTISTAPGNMNTPVWMKKSLPSLVAGDATMAADMCDSSTVHARSYKSLQSQPSMEDDEIGAGFSQQMQPGDCSTIGLSDDDQAPTNAADSFFESMGMSPAVLRSFDQSLLNTTSRTASISSLLTSITNNNNNACGQSKADSDSIASDLPTGIAKTTAARRPVSIIEKNARVIKWIHGCRIAPTGTGGSVHAKVIAFEFSGTPADV